MLNKSEIKIDFLKNHKVHLPVIIDWVYDEWWQFNDNFLKDDVKALYETLLNDESLPIALVALYNNEPIGSAILCQHDPDYKPELSPWLEGLYVKKEYRSNGIGKKLILDIERLTKKFNYKQLYLYTHKTDYYKKLGYKDIEVLHKDDILMIKKFQ